MVRGEVCNRTTSKNLKVTTQPRRRSHIRYHDVFAYHSILVITGEEDHSILFITGEEDHSILFITGKEDHSILFVTGEEDHSILVITGKEDHSILVITGEEDEADGRHTGRFSLFTRCSLLYAPHVAVASFVEVLAEGIDLLRMPHSETSALIEALADLSDDVCLMPSCHVCLCVSARQGRERREGAAGGSGGRERREGAAGGGSTARAAGALYVKGRIAVWTSIAIPINAGPGYFP